MLFHFRHPDPPATIIEKYDIKKGHQKVWVFSILGRIRSMLFFPQNGSEDPEAVSKLNGSETLISKERNFVNVIA